MRKLSALVVVAGAFALVRCDCGTPVGGDCQRAQDCAGNLVCDPGSHTCAAEVECTTHAACGTGAICVDETCAANTSGGACDIDDNCVAGEMCRSGTCLVPGQLGSPCATAEACAEGLVCADGTCGQDVACAMNDDCGRAAYCDDGTCAAAGVETLCEDNDDCTADARCLGVVCLPDVCEGQAFTAEPVAANVLLVVDRSGSMEDEIGNEGPKWEIAKAAVAELVTAQGGNIRFGLSLYPGNNRACTQPSQQCREGAIQIDVGADRAQAIISEMDQSDTCRLGTPTAEDLELVLDYAPLQDPNRNNYVLLITDGQSTCSNPVPLVRELAERTPPTPTFVVGFGNGVDPDELNDMAIAGGTALAGNRRYYQADDGASLDAALRDIAGEVLGCDYAIPPEYDDPALLSVFFNGQRVPPNTSGDSGWRYDAATSRLTFAGNACTALRAGSVTDLTIVFGCPTDDPPPAPTDAGTPPPACEQETLPCEGDGDCCPGSICIPSSGECIPLAG